MYLNKGNRMKQIEIDDELYQYIAGRTQAIGESASDILRRLLRLPATPQAFALVQESARERHTEKNAEKKEKPNAKSAKTNHTEQAVQRLEKLLRSDIFIEQKKNVARFTMILSHLYRANPNDFAAAVDNMHGSERLYFSRNPDDILATGSGTKAKKIPDSPYWVVTNNNSARKGIILGKVMRAMALPQHLIERIEALFS